MHPDLAWMTLVTTKDAGVRKALHDHWGLPKLLEIAGLQDVIDQRKQPGVLWLMKDSKHISFSELPRNEQIQVRTKVLEANLDHHRADMGRIRVDNRRHTDATLWKALQMQQVCECPGSSKMLMVRNLQVSHEIRCTMIVLATAYACVRHQLPRGICEDCIQTASGQGMLNFRLNGFLHIRFIWVEQWACTHGDVSPEGIHGGMQRGSCQSHVGNR